MRYALSIFFLMVCMALRGQSIPNYKMPVMVSHLSGTQKTMLYRVGAPKHNAFTRTICFKKACRSVIGWKRTQQRNKFKGYKKPGIPRLHYLKEDSLRETRPTPASPDRDTVTTSQAVVTSQPIQADSAIVFTFSDLLFETNSSTLNETFKLRLDTVATVIRQHEGSRISIVGHTDNSGRERSNAMLSQDRADAVARYLASTGISISAITTEGRGSSDPVADNATAEGRQKNRRVQIFLHRD
jgi:outer membrane protein OmpA-like peptidoglycan-associated protein